MDRPDETTPLLAQPQPAAARRRAFSWLCDPATPVLLAGFLITLSFSWTQVPILYIFRLMVCDDYYGTSPSSTGDDNNRLGDGRCDVADVAAGTAMQFAILGMSTTFCGTLNLFVSAWQAKKLGPRAALLLQVAIPAVRVATQIVGVLMGGRAGIIFFQTTQLITIFGGPAGYILIVNTIAGEVVEPLRRTAVFGQLQGCIMAGQALGYLVGGMVGDTFGVRRPFEVAFCSFLISTLYVRLAIPYIPPPADGEGKGAPKGIKGFFAPLKVLAPQLVRLPDGRVKKHYGVFFLCAGVFTGVLATGYVVTMILLYATAHFDFDQAENGQLTSGNALIRAIFLTFVFPKIIDWGRAWFTASANVSQKTSSTPPSETPFQLPTEPELFDAPTGVPGEDQPEPIITAQVNDRAAYAFDLYFLRWSLLVDAAVTSVAAFASEGWHIYLAGFLLPLASGTAPAAKGVITEMCPPSQRADALGAITLVENIARLSTLGLFGFVFSALTEVGLEHLTFFLNAGVAVVAMAVLMLSHFPPANSELVDNETQDIQECS